MSYVLPRLETKKDIDGAIKGTEDKVLVLRFGRESDIVCMQLDEIVGPPFFVIKPAPPYRTSIPPNHFINNAM